MRRIIVALALALTAPVAGCASLGAAVEQVQPRTAKEALAIANVAYVGAVRLAGNMYSQGVINRDDARALLVRFEQIDQALTAATVLVQAGDEVRAGRELAAIKLVLDAISVELAARIEAHRRMQA